MYRYVFKSKRNGQCGVSFTSLTYYRHYLAYLFPARPRPGVVLGPAAEARRQLDPRGGGGGAEEAVQRHGAHGAPDHHGHPRPPPVGCRQWAAVHPADLPDRGPARPALHPGGARRSQWSDPQ